MRLRKFHIDQFPHDRIFLLLKETFHQKLFRKIRKFCSFERLNSYFDYRLNKNTYKRWFYRLKKPKRRIPGFIPLWFILKIPSLLKDYSLKKIEKNIIAYKGPSTSSIVWRPKLPLIEDGRLLKVLAHCLGDGHFNGAFGTQLPKGKSHAEYRNFNKPLLDQFRKDLFVFGDVATSIDYDHGHIIFPNSVGYLLEHIYKIKTCTFVSSVPDELFQLPRYLIADFIRAFADDEGHVYDSSIEIYSANTLLLEGILSLVRQNFPEMKLSGLKVNIRAGKNPKYSFAFLNSCLAMYSKVIGFDHPEKRSDLYFNLRRQKIREMLPHPKNTKETINNLLKKDSLTAKEISRKLFIRHDTVLFHLNSLKNIHRVKIIGTGRRNDAIWSIVD